MSVTYPCWQVSWLRDGRGRTGFSINRFHRYGAGVLVAFRWRPTFQAKRGILIDIWPRYRFHLWRAPWVLRLWFADRKTAR